MPDVLDTFTNDSGNFAALDHHFSGQCNFGEHLHSSHDCTTEIDSVNEFSTSSASFDKVRSTVGADKGFVWTTSEDPLHEPELESPERSSEKSVGSIHMSSLEAHGSDNLPNNLLEHFFEGSAFGKSEEHVDSILNLLHKINLPDTFHDLVSETFSTPLDPVPGGFGNLDYLATNPFDYFSSFLNSTFD